MRADERGRQRRPPAAAASDATGYLQELWRDARIEGLVVDEGFPLPIIPAAELEREAGVAVHRVIRIEPWIAEDRDGAADYDELEDALAARLEAAAGAGRRGLQVGDRLPHGSRHHAAERGRRARGVHALARGRLPRDARTRQAGARPPARAHARGRLGERRARAHPLGRRRPGQPRAARPAGGPFDLLKRHPQQPVLLIHAGWPWTDEAAFLASILPHVYLDLSIGIPWASLAIDRLIETALGVAPPAKVLYGSDEASEPEVAWFSAHVAREALGARAGTAVERRWLTPAQATGIGEDVLAGNCRRLHGIAAR